MFHSRKNALRGFSMIEVTIVIIVLGILAAVAFPRYRSYLARTRYAEAMQVCTSIAKSEARYAYEHGALTPDLTALDISIPASSAVPGYTYYGWNTGAGVGFGLGRDASQSPTNVWTDHKIGMDMIYNNGSPKVSLYWWRADSADHFGGGTFHTSTTGWDELWSL